MSAAGGRVLGIESQHFSINTQTPSDSPRIPRFVGRNGRSPAMTSAGAAWGETWENGCSCAKTYGGDPLGLLARECSVANLVDRESL